MRISVANSGGRHRSAAAALALALLATAACGGGSGEAPAGDAGPAPGDPGRFGQREQAALAEAITLYSQGDFPKAFEAAKKALTAGPESAGAYAVISQIYIDSGQDPQAAEFFGLVARELGGPKAFFYLGYHQFRLNRWDDALAAFRRAAELDPKDAEARFREGLVLQARGDFEQAVAAMSAAWELEPTSTLTAARLARLHRITGNYEAAERLLEEALSRAPDNGDLLYASAQLRLREGRAEEAEALLRQAVARSPDLWEARYDLARALDLKGDRAAAERERRLARRLTDYIESLQALSGKPGAGPGDTMPLLTIAELHLTERRWPETLRSLARAQAAGADSLRVSCLRAEAHYGSRAPGLGDEAIAEIDAAVAGREPRGAEAARIALARAAGAIARRDVAAAARQLERASGPGAPDDRLFLLRVSDAYREIGRKREAEEMYRRSRASARPE